MFWLWKLKDRPQPEPAHEAGDIPVFRSVRGAYGPEARLVPADATPREAVGIRLRVERHRLGLSQIAFAAIGGSSKKTQMRYEGGERSPDADYLVAIHAAGADVLFILTGVRTTAVKAMTGEAQQS